MPTSATTTAIHRASFDASAVEQRQQRHRDQRQRHEHHRRGVEALRDLAHVGERQHEHAGDQRVEDCRRTTESGTIETMREREHDDDERGRHGGRQRQMRGQRQIRRECQRQQRPEPPGGQQRVPESDAPDERTL